MAADWLGKLGRRGFEALVRDVIDESVLRTVEAKIEPRLRSIETRLTAIEQRLDSAERLAKVESELAEPKTRA